MCDDAGCDHRDYLPRRRADEDRQPFGMPYKGPALPQHVVDMDGPHWASRWSRSKARPASRASGLSVTEVSHRQLEGWRHPRRHVARSVEARIPAELANLLTLDALIRTYAHELEDLMLHVRCLYRGGDATERQARFLADLARSLDDLAIDARGDHGPQPARDASEVVRVCHSPTVPSKESESLIEKYADRMALSSSRKRESERLDHHS